MEYQSTHKNECVMIQMNGFHEEKEEKEEVHSLLRGGRPNYPNTWFSKGQMQVISALCDTLVPSIDIHTDDPELKSFFATSASQFGVPEYVAGYVSERLIHAAKVLFMLALWSLTTWLGTLILCGKAAFSSKFPFVRNFTKIPQHEREKIILSWSKSRLYKVPDIFKAAKAICCLSFYSKADKKRQNPAWKAIGYCGPDPTLNKITSEGPLEGKVVDLGECSDANTVLNLLQCAQCKVSRNNSESSRVSEIFMGKPRNSASLTISCDVVVVGSGSGGGVIAGVLAKAGLRVVVIEKGKYFARNQLSLLEGPSFDQMYDGGGLVASDNLNMFLLAGSTVGGGSCINWSASFRTPQHVMTEWTDKLKIPLFDSEMYAHAMNEVCRRLSVHEGGCRHEGFNNSVLRKGCQLLGYPVKNIPRNGDPDHYCGWCCFGCKDGTKQGTHETWLVDAVNSGAVILSSCEAVKVMTEKTSNSAATKHKRATGVVFKTGLKGSVKVIVESKATVVACGAIRTPKLLRRSGLKNKNIGKNLHLHPVRMGWGYFPETDWPPVSMKSFEGGIMSAMCPNHGATGYGTVIQTPSLHPGMFSVLMPWTSALDMKQRMTKFSRTAHVFALARDKSSGTVDFPGHINYSICKEDEYNLRIGIEKVLRILIAAGAEEVGTHHFSGDRMRVKGASGAEIERFLKKASGRKVNDMTTPLCSAHQMGSCRMGKDKKCSVVDERGETWEVEGLFIGDASVLPTALGVNPMVTIQSIAFCTAHSILSFLRTA